MAECPTRLVRVRATGALVRVNVVDFDPALHENPEVPAGAMRPAAHPVAPVEAVPVVPAPTPPPRSSAPAPPPPTPARRAGKGEPIHGRRR